MIDTEWITDEELLNNARFDIESQIKNGLMYVIGEEPEPFDDGDNLYTIETAHAQYYKDGNKAHELLWGMFRKEYPQYIDRYEVIE